MPKNYKNLIFARPLLSADILSQWTSLFRSGKCFGEKKNVACQNTCLEIKIKDLAIVTHFALFSVCLVSYLHFFILLSVKISRWGRGCFVSSVTLDFAMS